MKLKEYQQTAVRELLEKSVQLIKIANRAERGSAPGRRTLIFKSPTGSGKTIMMAEFLRQLTDQQAMRDKLSFIWIAPRALHEQSKQKLETYYASNRALTCSNHGDLNDRKIDADEILFINWESINKKKKNLFIRENERETHLSKIVENTYQDGRDVVLVIDESHHAAQTQNAITLIINTVAPRLTIEVSATPQIQKMDELVSVDLFDVKDEGMIKKSVVLNEGFKNKFANREVETEFTTDLKEKVIDAALAKRAQLATAFAQTSANINPLLLVQLPDRMPREQEFVRTEVEEILHRRGITEANGKLAIYLSDEKENLANITRNDNETEVMLFKQAIALGWDCPRAHILVLFREWGSRTFSVQTLGRIMRMPDPSVGHYQNEILNNGYVFTDLSHVTIHEDISGGYVTLFTSTRDESYTDIELPSIYYKRQRERTRLNPRFTELFLLAAETYKLADEIDIDAQQVSHNLIADTQHEDVDALANSDLEGDLAVSNFTNDDLQRLFNGFAASSIRPLYPENRSLVRVRDSIYVFFIKYFQLYWNTEEGFVAIIKIVLSDENAQHFRAVIETAIAQYQKELDEKDAEMIVVDDWQIPQTINYSEGYVELPVGKSIMKPFYLKTNPANNQPWQSEAAFIRQLESSPQVEWWFKNGDSGANYFAVPYTDDSGAHAFYVDFIVRFTNGEIGLYDPKSGYTLMGATERRNGLKKYIAEHANTRGDIVANTDSANYSGQWMKPRNDDNEISDDFGEWELLKL